LSFLNTFNNILQDSFAAQDPKFSGIYEFSRSLGTMKYMVVDTHRSVTRLVESLKSNPVMFVELLFAKTRSQAVAIHYGYGKPPKPVYVIVDAVLN